MDRSRLTVVIAGRPNVGKSTLFNRWTGERKALVHRAPGMTRDRIARDMGPYELIDTGGIENLSDDELSNNIRKQAHRALEEASLILFIVDGAAGLHPLDEDLSTELRRLDRPVYLLVNKSDTKAAEENLHEFDRLGWPTVHLVSAEHNMGIETLKEEVEEFLGVERAAKRREEAPRIAVVGKPNVGKSSLVNALLGNPRLTVSSIPGTTRDAVDVLVERGNRRYIFIDTAGFRRKSRVKEEHEKLSVVMSLKGIQRADLCLILLDLSEPITHQDREVVSKIVDEGKAAAIIGNKSDLVPPEADRNALTRRINERLTFLDNPPTLLVSALHGKNVGKIWQLLDDVLDSYRHRISTGVLNRIFRECLERYPSKRRRFYYISQVGTSPPRFVLHSNLSGRLPTPMERYLRRQLMEAFPSPGIPLLFKVKKRS